VRSCSWRPAFVAAFFFFPAVGSVSATDLYYSVTRNVGLAVTLGLRVPEDLSVVGFDGIGASGWTQPPLTTVEQPIDEIAYTALAALRAQVDRPVERQPSYVFRPRLRLGGTTAPPPS